MILPERLIEARTSAGLSLGQVARFTGLPRSDIEAYEAGLPIPVGRELTLLDIYHVDPKWLRGYDRPLSPDEMAPLGKLHPNDVVSIMRTLQRMQRTTL